MALKSRKHRHLCLDSDKNPDTMKMLKLSSGNTPAFLPASITDLQEVGSERNNEYSEPVVSFLRLHLAQLVSYRSDPLKCRYRQKQRSKKSGVKLSSPLKLHYWETLIYVIACWGSRRGVGGWLSTLLATLGFTTQLAWSEV